MQRTSRFPAYTLSSPSVAIGAGIVVATSAGSVHLVRSSRTHTQLLVTVDSVPGQVRLGTMLIQSNYTLDANTLLKYK